MPIAKADFIGELALTAARIAPNIPQSVMVYLIFASIIGALLAVILLSAAYLKKKAKESSILYFLNETNCEIKEVEIKDQEFQITKEGGMHYLDKNTQPTMIRNGIFGWKPFYIFYNGVPCHLQIDKNEVKIATDTLKEFLKQKTLERLLKPEEEGNAKLFLGLFAGLFAGVLLTVTAFALKWVKI